METMTQQPTGRATHHQFLHSGTWAVWLCAAVVAVSATRNPLYLILLLLCLLIVAAVVQSAPTNTAAPLLLSPVSFTLLVTTLSATFNMLTTHYGQTVLFQLPAFLPLLGGNVTLEGLVYGASNGLVIAGLFAAFTVLNMALPIHAIIRFIPRAFYPLAIVISIAVTFVPSTLRQLQHIREAQAVRGHRLRGLRDWLPLIMPLLTGGLERALQLAEAMTARGFASTHAPHHQTLFRVGVVAALTALLVGWLLRLAWGYALVGGSLMLAGAGLFLAVLWLAGKRTTHTVYRREHWQRTDGVVLAGAVLVLTFFLALVPGIDRKALYYSPYPVAQLPPFNPLVGGAILGLLLPAVLMISSTNRDRSQHYHAHEEHAICAERQEHRQ